MQCDFDTIGTTSNAADIETLLIIHDLLVKIGFTRFTIRVNNRMVLSGLLEKLGLTDKTAGVLRALDKLAKTSREDVIAEMTDKVGATAEQAGQVLDLASLTGSNTEILDRLETLLQGSNSGLDGVARLRELFQVAETAGIPAERVQLDVSIARGLDYYTGTIYETFLTDMPKIGSVCSGGRYDNLAGLFTKEKLPGVGGSLGLDRLLAAMEDLGLIEQTSTPAHVLIACFEADRIADYCRIGRVLRQAGIGAEVFPDAKKVGQQLKYADRKGFRLALIAGSNEFAKGVWQVKDLKAMQQSEVPESELVAHLQAALGLQA
jgi:histidyl-tRNA synthetase